MQWIRAGIVLVLVAGADVAQGKPGYDFFEGTYELVGRGPDGALFEGSLKLERSTAHQRGARILGADGEPRDTTRWALFLAASDCDGPAGRLDWKKEHEVWRLQGSLLGGEVSCTYTPDGDNYPILLCFGEGGARLTAWPRREFHEALACE